MAPTRKLPVGHDSDLSYTNKLTGKLRRFTPRPNEIVASFQPGQKDNAEMTELARRRVPLEARVVTETPDFAVYALPEESDIQSGGGTIEELPGVANIIPVMTDDEGLVRHFLPDEIGVRFRDDIGIESVLERIQSLGASVIRAQRTPGYYTVSVPEGSGLFETIRALNQLDEVIFAEPGEIGIDDFATDLARQWALKNTGQVVNDTQGVPEVDIDIDDAWAYTKGSPNVVIVVIDTGIKSDHPNLAPNILSQDDEDWNFADDAQTSAEDNHGHGTHVAGIAAGADIGSGIVGVAPDCRLIALRVNLNSGNYQSRADAINYISRLAIRYPDRRFVINLSWRMAGDHAGVYASIQEAVSKGILVVVAAGNANVDTSTSPFYPTAYPEALAVGATTQSDKKASISNYGKMVDVFAPGVNIYSTYVYDPYAFLDGTSQACPHVAGLAGLIWSLEPALTTDQVRQLIAESCVEIDGQNPDYSGKLGSGRINAGRALAAVSRLIAVPQSSTS